MSFLASKENRITIAIILGVLLLVGYYAYQSWESYIEESNPNQAREALTTNNETGGYTDIDGNQVSLEDYLGKIIIVNSWASWSPASAQEIPALDSLASQYSADEVVFLAINRMEPSATAERFINRFSQTKSIKLLLDPSDKFYKSIDGFSMPETVIYNASGAMHHHYRGRVSTEDLRQQIEQLIQSEQ